MILLNQTLKSVIAAALIGFTVYSILPVAGVSATETEVKLNKQAESQSGTVFEFAGGTVTNYKPLKFIDNLSKYPAYYLETKDITGDILFTKVTDGDEVVNTQMIRTLAEMSYVTEDNLLNSLTVSERDEVFQGLIWQELSGTSREDKFNQVSGNDTVKDMMSKVYDLARVNIENQVELIPKLGLIVDQDRATYDKRSSGYIYYGPVQVRCDVETTLSIGYSKAGAVLVDRIGGETLNKLTTGTNFYVRFDKDKSFTDFFINFTGRAFDKDVVFLSVNSNKPNIVAVMPINREMKAILDFKSINNKATIKVKKEPAVSGFEYTVYTEEGTKVLSQMTNSNGEAVFNNMEIGKYIVKETKTPDYYTLDEKEYEVELVKNGDEVIVNTSSVRQLAYLKINVMDNLSPVRGCAYQVASKDSTDYNKEVVVDGQDTFELPLGTYTVKETATNSLYELNQDTFTVTLGSEGSTEEITVPKAKANSFVEFQVNGFTGTILMDIKDNRGNLITTFKINGNTRIGMTPGEYTMVIKDSGDQIPSLTTLTFKVINGEVVTIPLHFEKSEGAVTFTTTYDGNPVGSVGIDIHDIDGNIVNRVTTDSSGTVSLTDLKYGTYMAVVSSVPSGANYSKSEVPFIFEGVDLNVTISLEEGVPSKSNSNKDDEDDWRTWSRTSNNNNSSGGTTVENPYPTLGVNDEGSLVENPYPTLNAEGYTVPGSSVTLSADNLPKTGLSDGLDYRLLVAALCSLITFTLTRKLSFKRRETV